MENFKDVNQLDNEAKAILSSLEGVELTPKVRLSIDQQEMPQQDPSIRNGNMDEVSLGYTASQLKVEVIRCLQCKTAPCIKGCPVAIDIPAFIKAAGEEKFAEALEIINKDSLLPAICGRVCPQERQCMATCMVGKSHKDAMKSVAIGRIERYIADIEMEKAQLIPVKPSTGKKVAVVGSGPSGLTAAAELIKEGHEVHLFEAFHKAGGVTIYGIPEFRLPKKIVQLEVDRLIKMGVQFHLNFLVGRTRKLQYLLDKDGFDVAYVATGAGLPTFPGIEGENLVGVFSANEFLTRSNLMKAYQKGVADTPIYEGDTTVVLGGGNVAMDSARTAKRMGAKRVILAYRRTRNEMPARAEEIEHAVEEGIELMTLVNPIRIIGDENGFVKELECLRYQLGEADESGRCSPLPILGSEFILKADSVIVAIGNSSNPLISQTTEKLDVTSRGNIIVDENQKSSLDRIYAGGDIVLGAATVILAMGDGKRAAKAINKILSNK